ncbi:hypothetical protein GCM10027431_11130 [Lysobacter rhizosphaerae]
MDTQYRVRFAISLVLFGVVTAVMVPVLLGMGVQATLTPLYAIVTGIGVAAITLVCLLQSVKRRD